MIVEVATRLFDESGYADTSIDDIARAAGVAKPTVYQYVPNKAWLLDRIFDVVLGQLRSGVDDVRRISDPAAQMHALVQHLIDVVHDYQPYLRIYFGEESALAESTRSRIRTWAREINHDITAVVERAQQAGVVRDRVDPSVATNLLVGMLTTAARWYDRRGPMTKDEIAQQALLMLQGFIVTEEPR